LWGTYIISSLTVCQQRILLYPFNVISTSSLSFYKYFYIYIVFYFIYYHHSFHLSTTTLLSSNLPLGIAPGIGLSTYLLYGLTLGEKYTLSEIFTSVSTKHVYYALHIIVPSVWFSIIYTSHFYIRSFSIAFPSLSLTHSLLMFIF